MFLFIGQFAGPLVHLNKQRAFNGSRGAKAPAAAADALVFDWGDSTLATEKESENNS